MSQPQIAPFGSWKSPITVEDIYAKGNRLGSIRLDGADLYWGEFRPDGRMIIVRQAPNGTISDITPPGFNVRTRVHEYGGGAYFAADGVVYFSNFLDQKLYRQVPSSAPEPLSTGEGFWTASVSG
jgi:hypothetical protein